ncbi:MAG TPA: hypothetical protein VK324_04135 [Tepidisphaeraceae bacterium]|nr:hypothetical protein [Tepidisphaeraceae bacterium]
MVSQLKLFLHEYRNAVHALQLSIDLLRLGHMDEAEALEWLEIVEREADAVIRSLDHYVLDDRDAPGGRAPGPIVDHPNFQAPPA